MSTHTLSGKVALITGGGNGIGRATALLLAKEGAAIAVVDINGDAANEVAHQIISAGGKAIPITADVSSEKDARRSVHETAEALGELSILFNNAGIIRRASVTEISIQEWDQSMAVNLRSVFLMSRFRHSVDGRNRWRSYRQYRIWLGTNRWQPSSLLLCN